MKTCGLLLCVVLAVAVACSAAAPDGAPPAAPVLLADVPETPDLDSSESLLLDSSESLLLDSSESLPLEEALQIPVVERACTHAACDYECLKRGYRYGRCASATLCYCYR